MAIIWKYSNKDANYEVRSAGNSLRLYTNGVFHSQYNPNNLFTGGIWDALCIPSLFGSHTIKKILVLGVGGGTAIHQLQKLLYPEKIVGVEINPVHLDIAKKFFKLNYKNLTLVNRDAVSYMRRQRTAYDLIVDDIFLEGGNNPYRPVSHTGEWTRLLNTGLSEQGILVQNYLSNAEANRSLKSQKAFVKHNFPSVLRMSVPCYENAVIAFFKTKISAKDARLKTTRYLRNLPHSKGLKKLRYQLKTIN